MARPIVLTQSQEHYPIFSAKSQPFRRKPELSRFHSAGYLIGLGPRWAAARQRRPRNRNVRKPNQTWKQSLRLSGRVLHLQEPERGPGHAQERDYPTGMTTGSFAPNYRNQDCGGWKVNDALQDKGYLRCVKNGWGNENSYSLTQKGVKLMNLVMAKFPIGSTAPVGAGGVGVGVGVPGSATGHYTGKVMGGYGGFGHNGLSAHGLGHALASMGTFPTAIGMFACHNHVGIIVVGE
ncbi:hypothetical protein SARC_08884 [Sphaeroforma arctica JP610]|uniref:Uncharacterized protein n=1 Tax=Sphaeroforma arctica JP610 TaxID=667725 RepID=A0A0L0FPF6_9EUKA|nr:hypothetical protein SARC_08884 [Sphaeroforma arctica JP610]KNC78695.1 hypothetical protein SARC_08884 [Sphaeroforma arctica JP610]|eukprot:XP_014152597.1 hypothetical protein SARC_08884 [Sphaeroforma arctica JP610]